MVAVAPVVGFVHVMGPAHDCSNEEEYRNRHGMMRMPVPPVTALYCRSYSVQS